jgi:Fe-S cluster biogenesis protein NfuA
MFIQVQETPNPLSLMFLPGQAVMGENDPVSFAKTDACQESSFARRLLDIQGVDAVFLGRDFITVTKVESFDWYVLKPNILGAVMEPFVNKLRVMDSVLKSATVEKTTTDGIEDAVVVQIKEIIDTRVRPAVANDGGDILFHSFEDGIVYLEMKGACAGCPSSTMTLKSGIENMLKFYVPEVEEVRQIHA